MENIRSFAVTSIEKGLDGLLLTLWDDDSPHFELYMRGILAFAEYSWSGEKRSKQEIKAAYRHREFSSTLAGEEFAFIDQLERPVAIWNHALLDRSGRRALRKLENPFEEAIIDLPDADNKGQWSDQYVERLELASDMMGECDSIAEKISVMKAHATRNTHRLEIYEQVNNLVRFSAHALLALKAYDNAENEQAEVSALSGIQNLPVEFNTLRAQSISFDWLFIAEMLFLEKVESTF